LGAKTLQAIANGRKEFLSLGVKNLQSREEGKTPKTVSIAT